MSDLRDIARRMIAASGMPRLATSLAPPDRARARAEGRTIWVAVASSMGDKEGMIGLADARTNVQDGACIVFDRPLPADLRHVHRDANFEDVEAILGVFGL